MTIAFVSNFLPQCGIVQVMGGINGMKQYQTYFGMSGVGAKTS